MPTFVKGGEPRTPFGKNVFLRSTSDVKTRSYTVAAGAVPEETVDGSTQKILQPGEVMAAITSGPYAGMIGPFQAAGTAEVQTLTKAGTISGGTFTITVGDDTTDDLDYTATHADVQAALEGLESVGTGNVTVTGGPIASAAFTITFGGELEGNQPAVTVDDSALTGTDAGITVATSTEGSDGALDGRSDTDNIVGILETFLPWQLLERDVEVAVVYDASVVQAWCFERNAAGARVALGNTTAGNLVAKKSLSILFN